MAHLSLGVLGPLQVLIDNQPVTALESDKVFALLIFLTVESRCPHTREALAGLLWPDCPEQAARHNLRQALFNLRLVIGDRTADPPYLLISHDAILFNSTSDFSLDLARFNTILHSCEEDKSRGIEDPAAHAARLEEMVNLYRGEFLQGFSLEDSAEFEEWTLVKRESMHQHVLNACGYLSRYYEQCNDYPASRRYASRQLELDPWREEAHCQMMRALAFDGQRSAALAQYETCRRVLAEELGVEPSAATRELYEQIRTEKLKRRDESPIYIPAPPIQNLPVPFTSFLGREQELSDLGQLIANPECRCISLVGPGGTGKTRLALRTGEQHMADFAQGVVFIPLAPDVSGEAVIPAIASAIHLFFYGPTDPRVQLLSYLREKQILLILDSVEQVLADIREIVLDILQNAPGVKLIITSREVLNLQGEWVFEVGGLAVPEAGQTEKLDEYAAVALFIQRARHASFGLALNEADLAEIARICRLVDGMPLAIELAASWLRALTPAEIAQEIAGSLDFLSASMRDLPERHRSMRVVFDHSWQMLSVNEQQALSQLSVFRGGFSRQAAQQVAGATLPVLSSLINQTLLTRDAGGRYQQHVLVRRYSAMHLLDDPQAHAAARKRHCTYFLELAETAEQELKGRHQLEWLRRLDQEQDNLRAALEWALENGDTSPGDDEFALRLSGALGRFWRMHCYFHEGQRWLNKSLQQRPEKRTAARALAILGKSLLMNAQGDTEAAVQPAEEGAAIFRALGDQHGLAEALSLLATTSIWQGKIKQGQVQLEEALDLFRKTDDRWGEAMVLYRLGSTLADYSGDPKGRVMLEESAAILEDLGEKYVFNGVLIASGVLDVGYGNYATAREHFEHALRLAREIEHPWGITDALTNLGCLYRILGEYSTAQFYLEQSLQVFREHGSILWEVDVRCAMAENAITQGDFSTARFCLQVASKLLVTSENKWLQMLVCFFWGLLDYYEMNHAAAEMLLGETISLSRESQYKPDLARSLVALGRVKRALGQVSPASELLLEGLDLFRELGHKLGMASAIEELGAVSAVQGEDVQAVMLFSTAHALREGLGAPIPPVDRAEHEAILAGCRAQLGATAFDETWLSSATRPYQDVVDELLKSRLN